MGKADNEWLEGIRQQLGKPVDAVIDDEDLRTHLRAALVEYAGSHPQVVYTDLDGDGSKYDFDLPTTWEMGFSDVLAVEYPQGERPAVFLEPAEFVLYPASSAPTAVRLLDTIPAAGEHARLFWTATWPEPGTDPADDLTPAGDFGPICALAGSFAAIQLAGRAAGNKNSSLPTADAAEWQEEHDRWLAISRALRARYNEAVGAGAAGAAIPAEVIIDWDTQPTFIYSGRRYLTRRRAIS